MVSCDTIFYKFAYETWLRLGGSDNHSDAKDPFVAMAKAFGLGKETGIDLPDDVAGRIPDRAWKQAYWESTKKYYCGKAKTGFPEVAKDDPSRAAFLTQLAKENCADGNVFRGGDAANFAIGQGDMRVSPLQMVRVYAAIANGGTLWTPHLGKAIVTPAGKLVQTHRAEEGRPPCRCGRTCSRSCSSALRGVVTSGTAAAARSPGSRCRWPARPAPARSTASRRRPGSPRTRRRTSRSTRSSVVVSQGGTGASTSAPDRARHLRGDLRRAGQQGRARRRRRCPVASRRPRCRRSARTARS